MQTVEIASLGQGSFASPIHQIGAVEAPFKSDFEDRILYANSLKGLHSPDEAMGAKTIGNCPPHN